jgi:hypothetical protein
MVGSVRAARRAGIAIANSATIARPPTTTTKTFDAQLVSIIGSQCGRKHSAAPRPGFVRGVKMATSHVGAGGRRRPISGTNPDRRTPAANYVFTSLLVDDKSPSGKDVGIIPHRK